MTARWLASRQAASLQQRWPGPERSILYDLVLRWERVKYRIDR
jgi:hypothetical protein